jgi:gliding motility-associated-like protein
LSALFLDGNPSFANTLTYSFDHIYDLCWPKSTFARMRKLLVALTSLLCPILLVSQVEVSQDFSIDEYVNDILLGTGIQASNITYTGADMQIGYLTGGDGTIFPLDAGLVLSTADAANLQLPDGFVNVPFGEGVTGDPDLLDIANSVPPLIGQNFNVSSVNDLCILEFDFIATGDTMRFNYSFGSDEYLEWVNSSFNDIFAFFLSGPGLAGPYASPPEFPDGAINIAQLPGTDPPLPITISSVNDIENPAYYIDNVANDDIACDGFTVTLEAWSQVVCGETYHIKLAIADGTDTALESVVVLEAGSFESNAVVEVDLEIDVGGPEANVIYEDCGLATLTFTRPLETIIDIEEMVLINYGGTALNGVDYSFLPDTLIFEPFQTTIEFVVDAFLDGIDEGVETVEMEILNLAACNGGGLTTYFTFEIADIPDPLVVEGYEWTMCSGDTVEIAPIITGGYGNFVFEWDTGDDTESIIVSPPDTTTYNVIVSDTCDMPSDMADIIVNILQTPPLSVEIAMDTLFMNCENNVPITALPEGGDGMYTYDWETDNNWNLGTFETAFYSSWMGSSSIFLEVTDGCGLTATDEIPIFDITPPLELDLGPDFSVACNETFVLEPEITGGGEPYFTNWWDENFNWLGNTPTLSTSTDTEITIQLDVSDNCFNFISDFVTITIVNPPIEIVLDDEVEGDCTETFNISAAVSGGSPAYSVQWVNDGGIVGGTMDVEFQSFESTVLYFNVTDNCDGTAQDSVLVNIVNVPPDLELGPNINASCIDNTLMTATVENGSPDFAFEWIVDGTVVSNLNELTWQSYESVPVYCNVIDECGMTDEDSLIIFIPDIPLEIETTPDTAICIGGSIGLTALASGGEGGFSYQWPGLGESGNTVVVDPAMFMEYEVVATDICGESITDWIEVEVEDIDADFYIEYISETDVQFFADTDPYLCDSCDFYWDFGDGGWSLEQNPVHSYDGLDQYFASLTVVSEIGCTSFIAHLVERPLSLFIPNAFTPDNDGINDAWIMYGDGIVSFEIFVFDRWGELVWQTNDLTERWVGNHQSGGYYVPNGIYSWIVEMRGINTDAITRTGHVSILR